jgi:hypothetical protein
MIFLGNGPRELIYLSTATWFARVENDNVFVLISGAISTDEERDNSDWGIEWSPQQLPAIELYKLRGRS